MLELKNCNIFEISYAKIVLKPGLHYSRRITTNREWTKLFAEKSYDLRITMNGLTLLQLYSSDCILPCDLRGLKKKIIFFKKFVVTFYKFRKRFLLTKYFSAFATFYFTIRYRYTVRYGYDLIIYGFLSAIRTQAPYSVRMMFVRTDFFPARQKLKIPL